MGPKVVRIVLNATNALENGRGLPWGEIFGRGLGVNNY
jgi:hypothetical protein